MNSKPLDRLVCRLDDRRMACEGQIVLACEIDPGDRRSVAEKAFHIRTDRPCHHLLIGVQADASALHEPLAYGFPARNEIALIGIEVVSDRGEPHLVEMYSGIRNPAKRFDFGRTSLGKGRRNTSPAWGMSGGFFASHCKSLWG
ncbi:hypothetical protein [Bosea sp. BIWAKO-01]|uniref:hypothetical protein n=1 Tax=Bosea sp. BIWAKO-01 TaxID=506668 RepID=UPI001FCD3588|nr:hypothetical protein [Bosea sp. BIWAKO-01]